MGKDYVNGALVLDELDDGGLDDAPNVPFDPLEATEDGWEEALPRNAAYMTATPGGRLNLQLFLEQDAPAGRQSVDAAGANFTVDLNASANAGQGVDIETARRRSSDFALADTKTRAKLIEMASLSAPPDMTADEDEKMRKYGTFNGVFIRVAVSIFGVMMFLRMGWLVGNAGLGLSILLVLTSVYITITTTFSITALCTNGRVMGGGPYFIVSRSVGIEFGTTIGILVTISQMVAIALNTVGFAEEVVKLYAPSYFTHSRDWDTALVALGANLAITLVALGGVGWVNHINLALFICIMGGFFSFLIGTIVRKPGYLPGFTGWSTDSLKANWNPHYEGGTTYMTCLGVFFPSVTGILAGVNLSGELKDPGRNISVGTLGAIVYTAFVYLLILVFNAALALPATLRDIKTQNFMVDIAIWPPLVYAGIFSATLSTALGLLVGAPRVFAATLKDGLFPRLMLFAKLSKSGDPIRGYFLAIVVASLVIVATGGQLNAIAPFVTCLYTLMYGIINYACFMASIGRSVGWRPSFRYYNKWHALSGVVGCVIFMFLTQYIAAIIISVFALVVYKYTELRKVNMNLGDAHEAFTYVSAMRALWTMESNMRTHVKNYRPSFFVPANYARDVESLLKMAAAFYKGRGVIIQGTVIAGGMTKANLDALAQLPRSVNITVRARAFCANVISPSVRDGMSGMLQTAGISKVRPNTLFAEFNDDWKRATDAELDGTLELIRNALRLDMGVVVARSSRTLFQDYSFKATYAGNIDVFWLCDDGGLTVLLPYLLTRNYQWTKAPLRVHVPQPSGDGAMDMKAELDRLLKGFRIEAHYTGTIAASDRQPRIIDADNNVIAVSPSPFTRYSAAIEQKTRESLVAFVTMPLPDKHTTGREFHAWLDQLSVHQQTLFVRGNHQNVLTPFL